MHILTVEHISSLEGRIITLSKRIEDALNRPSFPLAYSNEALGKLLNVSSRTLQEWRDTGKIKFSKVGRLIFYRHEDVSTMLYEHTSGTFQFESVRCRRKTNNHFKTSFNGK